MKPAPSKGFTLIELMIAILVASIIGTVGYVVYSQGQVSARDIRRKSDLRTIAQALDIYRQKNNRYPSTTNFDKSTSGYWIDDINTPSGSRVALDKNYINIMPRDPKTDNNFVPNSGTIATGYAYISTAMDGTPCAVADSGKNQFYMLAAGLENGNDPDANGTTPKYKDCKGNNVTNANAFVILSP